MLRVAFAERIVPGGALRVGLMPSPFVGEGHMASG